MEIFLLFYVTFDHYRFEEHVKTFRTKEELLNYYEHDDKENYYEYADNDEEKYACTESDNGIVKEHYRIKIEKI